MSSWQIEMLWRCTSCRHQNRGRDMACASCGSPKDGSEEYEMPDDVSQGAAVTDQKLLELATGGENWRCAFCGSDARNKDGECARCGGGREHGKAIEPEVAAAAGVPSGSFWSRNKTIILLFSTLPALFLMVVLVRGCTRPTALVRGYGFTATYYVQRYLSVRREGFAEQRPADATDIKPLGDRVHHHDQILIGTKEESYQEKVQDGVRTETYSVRESCGQTCTPRPQNCRTVCKPNKNGFASCNNVCTGGGQSCTTNYCNVTKTRSVPVYKWVSKTRTVPIYRSEPRYAPFFAWTQMDWVAVRTVRVEGTGNTLPTLSMEQLGEPAGTLDSDIRLNRDQPTFWVEVEYKASGEKRTCKVMGEEYWRKLALEQKVSVYPSADSCTITSVSHGPAPTTVAGELKITRTDLPPPPRPKEVVMTASSQ